MHFLRSACSGLSGRTRALSTQGVALPSGLGYARGYHSARPRLLPTYLSADRDLCTGWGSGALVNIASHAQAHSRLNQSLQRDAAPLRPPALSFCGKQIDNIIADGRERLLDDSRTQERIAKAVQSVMDKYKLELEQAGLWRKLWLRWRVRAEVRKEIQKIAPSKANYFSASTAESQKQPLRGEA